MKENQEESNEKVIRYKFDAQVKRLVTPVIAGLHHNVGELLNDKDAIFEVKALWDTGSTTTIICPALVEALKLEPIAKEEVKHIVGDEEVDVYFLDILLPQKVVMQKVRAICLPIQNKLYDIIIGMDIIKKGKFTIESDEENTYLNFEVNYNTRIKVVNKEEE